MSPFATTSETQRRDVKWSISAAASVAVAMMSRSRTVSRLRRALPASETFTAAGFGQKPQITAARKSIAQFKLREGQPIGAHVTLRGDRAWEFLDRLLSLALPRIRDFRGLSDKQFDGHGNYTFGLTEQSMFHGLDQDKIDRVRGFDITVVTTAKNDEEGRALLKALGFPFRNAENTPQ